MPLMPMPRCLIFASFCLLIFMPPICRRLSSLSRVPRHADGYAAIFFDERRCHAMMGKYAQQRVARTLRRVGGSDKM
jgi:hypothetical protein